MRPHLLRVTREAGAFAGLIRALGEAGERVGWLELAAPSSLPAELEAAAGRGVLRAVAAGDGRSVAVKPLKGEPVLKDLLREHFRGCRLVLVRGDLPPAKDDPVPSLEPREDGWLVTPEGAAGRTLTTDRLIAALAKPRPWNRTESAAQAPRRGTEKLRQ
jgi:hypothetical protein